MRTFYLWLCSVTLALALLVLFAILNVKDFPMTLLSVVIVVFLVLAAFGVNPPRVSLGWLGLALWTAVALFG